MSHFETRLHEIVWKPDFSVLRQAPGRAAPFAKWAQVTLCDVRKRAKARGIEYGLGLAWLRAQLAKQNYCCAVSGLPFSDVKLGNAHKRPWMPSIDRIDCTKGYTRDNVRIVCVAVNTLLQDWGDPVWLAIKLAARHQ